MKEKALKESSNGRPLEDMQTVLVAQRYFIERRTKRDIAQELGLSRFKVARLIESSLKSGLVRIEINKPAEVDVELSSDLRSKYSLNNSLVLDVPDLPSHATREHLGALGASFIGELLEPSDVIGIAWGRTLNVVAGALPMLPSSSVVQIVGGMPYLDTSLDSSDLVRRVAARTGGDVYPLLAPLLLQEAEAAATLRREPTVRRTLQMFSRLNKAIVGIGSWDPPSSRLLEVLSEEDRSRALQLGVQADICALMFRPDGSLVENGFAPRSISIGLDELRAVPEVIAVAGGTDKARAIHAVLRSGIVSTLVTDGGAARVLLEPSLTPGRASSAAKPPPRQSGSKGSSDVTDR